MLKFILIHRVFRVFIVKFISIQLNMMISYVHLLLSKVFFLLFLCNLSSATSIGKFSLDNLQMKYVWKSITWIFRCMNYSFHFKFANFINEDLDALNKNVVSLNQTLQQHDRIISNLTSQMMRITELDTKITQLEFQVGKCIINFQCYMWALCFTHNWRSHITGNDYFW